MKICVVGGGLFGCTAAIYAARAGHDVHLYEKTGNILTAASGINQQRIHSGMHYPRSPETLIECQSGLPSFFQEYGCAIIDGESKFYAIAKEGSKISSGDYLAFLDAHGLDYTTVRPMTPALDILVQVSEARLDPVALYTRVTANLMVSGVHLYLNTPATPDLRDEYDQIIVAAYAGSNEVARALGCVERTYQFEVVEKPVLSLPDRYQDMSLVVMDGPFCCLDPYGMTGLHLMGHVKYAIHATNTGLEPDVPQELQGYLNRGVIEHPNVTNIEAMLSAAKVFIPFIDRAEHIGSMYVIRTVMPYRDGDDAQPTLVNRLDDKVIRIFSGKIPTACQAATDAVRMISTSHDRMDDRAQSVA